VPLARECPRTPPRAARRPPNAAGLVAGATNGAMKCWRWSAGRGRRLDSGAQSSPQQVWLRAAGPRIVAASTNPRFGFHQGPSPAGRSSSSSGRRQRWSRSMTGWQGWTCIATASRRASVRSARGAAWSARRSGSRRRRPGLRCLARGWATGRRGWWRWRPPACTGSPSCTRWSRTSPCGCATPGTSRRSPAARPTSLTPSGWLTWRPTGWSARALCRRRRFGSCAS